MESFVKFVELDLIHKYYQGEYDQRYTYTLLYVSKI